MIIEKKRKGILKINNQIKKSLYNWIMHHPQVFQSPIFNYCLKVNIDGHTGPKIVPKMLLQISVRELHNSLISDLVYGRIKEERYENDNIIISDSTLRLLFSPKLRKISSRYKVMCGCKCCISAKSIHHYYHGVIVI